MASIQQKSLFVWGDIDELGDLEQLRLALDQLRLALDQLPGEALMRKLEQKRYRGRDDYPVRAMRQGDTKLWQAGSKQEKSSVSCCAACFALVSRVPWEDTHPKNQNFATAKNPRPHDKLDGYAPIWYV